MGEFIKDSGISGTGTVVSLSGRAMPTVPCDVLLRRRNPVFLEGDGPEAVDGRAGSLALPVSASVPSSSASGQLGSRL